MAISASQLPVIQPVVEPKQYPEGIAAFSPRLDAAAPTLGERKMKSKPQRGFIKQRRRIRAPSVLGKYPITSATAEVLETL
jgi:hypothetical protein